MNIGLCDLDIAKRGKVLFPNLECLKMSTFYKAQGHSVSLETSTENAGRYHHFIIRQDTARNKVLPEVLKMSNVKIGGLAVESYKPLARVIEECVPDITLYNPYWRDRLIRLGSGISRKQKNRFESWGSFNYIRLFYDKWEYDFNKMPSGSFVIYDLNVTTHNWIDKFSQLYDYHGTKLRMKEPLILNTKEDVDYATRSGHFIREIPNRWVYNHTNDLCKFLDDRKTELSTYTYHVQYIYINEHFENHIDDILETIKTFIFAWQRKIKLSVFYKPSEENRYSEFKRNLSIILSSGYKGKIEDRAQLERSIIEEIKNTPDGLKFLTTPLEILKEQT